MERIAGRHVLQTTQHIADVAAYVGGPPPSTDTAPGAGQWLERGGRLYAERGQWCHGSQGEGSKNASCRAWQANSTNTCCGNCKMFSAADDRICARNTWGSSRALI
jgi:hypothetical protein